MKKNIFFTFVMLFSYILYAEPYLMITKLNSEISKDLRNKFKISIDSLINDIKNNNANNFKISLSKVLKEISNNEMDKFLKQLQDLLKKYDFQISDEYYSTVKKLGNDNNAYTVIPSMSDKSKFIINSLIFYTNEVYNIFMKSTNEQGVQYLLFISYGLYEEEWKINILQVSDYSVNNLSSIDLFNKSDSLYKENKIITSAIYSLAGKKLLRPKDYLQYPDEKKYLEIYEKVIKETNLKYKFPIKINDDFQIFSVNIELLFQGIVPVISYITKTSVNNGNEVKIEANKMLKEIYLIFPDLEKEFPNLLLKAFNEMPKDKNKTYTYFTTVIKKD